MPKKQRVHWVGPMAKTLEAVFRCKSPATKFVTIARDLLSQTKLEGPPFDARGYADALGIHIIEKENMTVDGILRWSNERGFEIALKKNADARRKNFTIAHEIAHTFFYWELEEFGEKFRGHGTYDQEEERLCDLAAAELIMPYSFFKSDLLAFRDRGVITPSTLFKLMDRYQISLRAVGIRVAWIIKNVACTLWKPSGRNFYLEWLAPFKLKPLIPCQTGTSSIEKAFASPGEMFTEIDSFYHKGNRIVRKTSSLRLRSGFVLSVLQPKLGPNKWQPERICHPATKPMPSPGRVSGEQFTLF